MKVLDVSGGTEEKRKVRVYAHCSSRYFRFCCLLEGVGGGAVCAKRVFFNARFLFCKDGAICAKNSPKRTSHGVARAIVKGTSLRSPSPIMAPVVTCIFYQLVIL